MTAIVCVDCAALPDDERPARPRPARGGPRSARCASHQRVFDERRKLLAHDAYVARTYGVPRGFYAALYDAQGGRCAICAWGRGASRRLAVDHDHACCPEPPICGRCVRGLCCAVCNEYLGRAARDNPDVFLRGAQYLREPPAQAVLIGFTEPVQ